jgi:methylmalonyl-CoA/ethylmalonyl-CoA epimerase
MSEPAVLTRGLNHVGILTDDLEAVRHVLGDVMGLPVVGPEAEPELGLEVLWVVAGEVRLEFVRPTDPASRAAQAIAAGQRGVHHLAFTVDDAAQALDRLRKAGVPARDSEPRLGVHGSRIGFLEPSAVAGTLIEVVQEKR